MLSLVKIFRTSSPGNSISSNAEKLRRAREGETRIYRSSANKGQTVGAKDYYQ